MSTDSMYIPSVDICIDSIYSPFHFSFSLQYVRCQVDFPILSAYWISVWLDSVECSQLNPWFMMELNPGSNRYAKRHHVLPTNVLEIDVKVHLCPLILLTDMGPTY